MSIEKLSVLVTVELGASGYTPAAIWWVAQCLEHDLATQARTLDGLVKTLQEIILLHVEACTKDAADPWQHLPPGPLEARARFEASYLSLELLPGAWMQPNARLPRLEIRLAV